jgi:hypothetical protein
LVVSNISPTDVGIYSAKVFGAGVCSSSSAVNSLGAELIVGSSNSIPTLGQWSIAILALLLMILGIRTLSYQVSTLIKS